MSEKNIKDFDEAVKDFDEDINGGSEIEEYLERDLDVITKARQKVNESKEKKNKKDMQPTSGGEKKDNSVIKFYRDNKLKCLWSALGVLVVILIIALIVTNIGGSEDSKDTEVTENETGNKEEEVTTGGNESSFIAEPVDSVYNKVIEAFLKNSYVSWNEEELKKVCDSIAYFNADGYKFLNKYIEDIEDVYCYVGDYLDDGKELIYVTYNIKFQNIETTLPTMEAFLLVKAEENYMIHNFELAEELDVYTNPVKDNQNYIDLRSGIEEQCSQALANDADLKKIYDALQNINSDTETSE